MWDLGYITYSGKVFSVKFWGMVSFGAAKASNLRKCSLRKSYFFTNSRKFSAIWCLHGHTQYRGQPPTMNITLPLLLPFPLPLPFSLLPSSSLSPLLPSPLPQGIGDSGQGFANAILFCLLTPKVRRYFLRHLCCCCLRKKTVAEEEDALSYSTAGSTPLYGSVDIPNSDNSQARPFINGEDTYTKHAYLNT